MDDLCLNIIAGTGGKSTFKNKQNKKGSIKRNIFDKKDEAKKSGGKRVRQKHLAEIVAKKIGKERADLKVEKRVIENKDEGTTNEKPKPKPFILARRRNVDGNQKKSLADVFSSDKKEGVFGEKKKDGISSEKKDEDLKKSSSVGKSSADTGKEVSHVENDDFKVLQKKTFKKSKSGSDTQNNFAKNFDKSEGSKKGFNKPGQKMSSLFGNNPEIPRIGQRLVKPINESVFAGSNFSNLNIHKYAVSNLEQNMKITKMTNVQQKAIPIILSGKDCLIRSQTGSGKTLAYALPIVDTLQKIQPKLTRNSGLKALVVVPTRELALQSYECFVKLVKPFTWIVPGYVVGGEKRKAEKARLRRGCNILVCTPGRLLDHLKHTKSLKINEVRFFVLDEADRMLDMGYERDVSEIVSALKVASQDPKETGYDGLAMLRQNTKKVFTSVEEETILDENTEDNDEKEDTAEEEEEEEEEEDEENSGDESSKIANKKEYHSGTDSDSDREDFVPPKKKKLEVKAKSLPKVKEAQVPKPEVTEEPDTLRRQTILLSATLTQAVEKLAGITMKNPVFVDAAKENLEMVDGDTSQMNEDLIVPQSVVQTYVVTPPKLRMVTLCAYIAGKCQTAGQHKIVVFMATQDMLDYHAEIMSAVLNKPSDEEDEDSEPLVDVEFFKLHGSMTQKERTEVFKTFRNARSGVLLCTDVAARGLDLPKVETVIQYTGPLSARDYVHRIGRTARAGSSGSALIFLTPPEVEFVRLLESKRIRIKQEDMDGILDKLIGPLSKHNNRQMAATALQNEFENLVLEQKKMHVLACKAYASWVRFYSSYPKDMREIFNRRELHLGHYAKSFALRDPPQKIGSIGRIAKEKEEKPVHNNRLGLDRPDGTSRKRPRGVGEADRRPNAMLKKVRMLNVSEFDSGLEPIKKPKRT